MTFREQAAADARKIIANENELGIKILLNDIEVTVITRDLQRAIVVNQYENSGMLDDIMVIYICDIDWPETVDKPVIGKQYKINDKMMTVDKSRLSFGTWRIDFKTPMSTGGFAGMLR